jgi:uncharacterized protein YjbI with pentapeptide repeats
MMTSGSDPEAFMANEEHVALLNQGVGAWNEWRAKKPHVRPDLSKTGFVEADLRRADLAGADLTGAYLYKTNLLRANLVEADLTGANLVGVNLAEADLTRADLTGANLHQANLGGANLSEATLFRAILSEANLCHANLNKAVLPKADLRSASLVRVDFANADLTGCWIYGVSAWELKLSKGTKQQNLVITNRGEPRITVDNIEVAQFVYLLLNNPKIRDVIDTIGKKGVLILGRFTPERKKVLDAIRDELRQRNYLPILFDFEKPADRDITETVSLLAHMARFIIADLTDPSSIPKELEAIVPRLAVPVQSLIEGSAQPFSMFKDLFKYDWMLRPYRYEGVDQLLATLADEVIAPAEAKVKALEEKRRMIEAKLTQPQ